MKYLNLGKIKLKKIDKIILLKKRNALDDKMEIYKKLPQEIQYKIYLILNIQNKELNLQDIINYRKGFIISIIYKNWPDIKEKTVYNDPIYYWFNIKGVWLSRDIRELYYPKNRYSVFLKDIFHDIDEKSGLYYRNLNDIYFHYKKTYIGNYSDFIDLILKKCSTEDIEDLYNYIKYDDYGDGRTNKSCLTINSSAVST